MPECARAEPGAWGRRGNGGALAEEARRGEAFARKSMAMAERVADEVGIESSGQQGRSAGGARGPRSSPRARPASPRPAR